MLRPPVITSCSAARHAAKGVDRAEAADILHMLPESNQHGLHQRKQVSQRKLCQIFICLNMAMSRAVFFQTAARAIQDRCKSLTDRHAHGAVQNMSNTWLRSLLTLALSKSNDTQGHQARRCTPDLQSPSRLTSTRTPLVDVRARCMSLFVFALCNLDKSIPSHVDFSPLLLSASCVFVLVLECASAWRKRFAWRAPDEGNGPSSFTFCRALPQDQCP